MAAGTKTGWVRKFYRAAIAAALINEAIRYNHLVVAQAGVNHEI
jgi:hypothetical protein